MRRAAGAALALLLLSGCGEKEGSWEEVDQLEKRQRQLAEEEIRKAEELKHQEYELVRARARAQLDRANDALRTIEEALGELSAWRKAVEDLETNADGKKLAAVEDYVAAFDELTTQERVSPQELEAAKRRVDGVVGTLERILDDRAPVLAPETEAGFSEVLASELRPVVAALSSYRDDRETLEAMVRDAGSRGPAAPASLRETVSQRREKLERERAGRIAEATDRVFETHTQEMVDLARERAETKARLDEERYRTETEDLARGAQARIDSIETHSRQQAQRAEEDRLRRLAADPAIQQKYHPILKRGLLQPRQNNLWDDKANYGRAGSYRGSVKYDLLATHGALNDFEKFLIFVCDASNDRGSWPKPRGDTEREEYQARFEEFKQLVPIWKEMGLFDGQHY